MNKQCHFKIFYSFLKNRQKSSRVTFSAALCTFAVSDFSSAESCFEIIYTTLYNAVFWQRIMCDWLWWWLYLMAAVTQVNENCSPQWKVIPDVYARGSFAVHRIARKWNRCRDACLFNPQCVAYAFAYGPHCYLYSHEITNFRNDKRFNTYKLVNRCDITPGLYFTDTINAT